jgi:hypothetical protein
VTSDAKYARKLAREYGITDPEEVAAIERTLKHDCERNDRLRAMAEVKA